MIKVLHIGHSRKWRGGENQVRLLIQGMTADNPQIQHHIAYPKGAIALARLKDSVKGELHLPSSRPFDLRSIIAIVRYCRQQKINIIDAQSANAHTLAYYAKLFLPAVHLVVHRRVDNPIKTNFLTRKKYLTHHVDKWIAISDKINNILVDYGIDPVKINTLKSGIDPNAGQITNKSQDKTKICEQFGWDVNKPLVGFAGALDGQKNPLLFVDIIAALNQNRTLVHAVMAGSGKLSEQVRNRIETLHMGDKLKMLGFVERMEIFFSSLDIFVLPSRNEGLGTVLLEAVHAGCAVVASNVGGISEIVMDEKTGRLVEPDSVQAFADAIQELIERPDKAERLKNAAVVHAQENFNLNTTIDCTARLYRELI